MQKSYPAFWVATIGVAQQAATTEFSLEGVAAAESRVELGAKVSHEGLPSDRAQPLLPWQDVDVRCGHVFPDPHRLRCEHGVSQAATGKTQRRPDVITLQVWQLLDHLLRRQPQRQHVQYIAHPNADPPNTRTLLPASAARCRGCASRLRVSAAHRGRPSFGSVNSATSSPSFRTTAAKRGLPRSTS